MLHFRLALTACILFVTTASTRAADEKITYVDHVQPIFRAKCFACHNPDKKSGGLDLTNYTAMKEGGSSGDVVEAGDVDSSYLWLLVNHESEPYMPPKADKLPAEMLDVIKAWIVGGALDTKSSKAVVRPKAKREFALSFGSTGRPDGPPPLPTRLSLQPVVHTEQHEAGRENAQDSATECDSASGPVRLDVSGCGRRVFVVVGDEPSAPKSRASIERKPAADEHCKDA